MVSLAKVRRGKTLNFNLHCSLTILILCQILPLTRIYEDYWNQIKSEQVVYVYTRCLRKDEKSNKFSNNFNFVVTIKTLVVYDSMYKYRFQRDYLGKYLQHSSIALRFLQLSKMVYRYCSHTISQNFQT